MILFISEKLDKMLFSTENVTHMWCLCKSHVR